jgi:tetratricopeptide (TPR) repeat protein
LSVPVEASELYQKGIRLAAEGDVHAALVAIERAVEIFPDFAEACKTLARLSLEVNEVRAFQNWIHEACRIDPADGEPYLLMGRLLASQGRSAEAIEALERAAALGTGESGRRQIDEILAPLEAEAAANRRRRIEC